jgi:hypothetical protein
MDADELIKAHIAPQSKTSYTPIYKTFIYFRSAYLGLISGGFIYIDKQLGAVSNVPTTFRNP